MRWIYLPRQMLRYLSRNTTLPARVRAAAQLRLSQMHCYTNPTQIRSRCIAGGIARGVFRDFRMGRVCFFPFCSPRWNGLYCSISIANSVLRNDSSNSECTLLRENCLVWRKQVGRRGDIRSIGDIHGGRCIGLLSSFFSSSLLHLISLYLIVLFFLCYYIHWQTETIVQILLNLNLIAHAPHSSICAVLETGMRQHSNARR